MRYTAQKTMRLQKKDKITTDEIVEAINLLERGKSVGKTDGITTKMVKNTNEKG